MARHSKVAAAVRSPPTASSTLPGHLRSSTNIRPPPVLNPACSLAEAICVTTKARPPVALVPHMDSRPPWRALFARDFLDFIAKTAVAQSSIIDLSEYTVADVLAFAAPVVISEIDRAATTGDAAALFFPSKTKEALRPRLLVVRDTAKPEAPLAGVIVHPEVRY